MTTQLQYGTVIVITMGWIALLGSLVTVIIGSIVIHDIRFTQTFHRGSCTIRPKASLHIESNGVVSYGYVDALVLGDNIPVTVTYPPIEHWELGGQRHSDIETWFEGLGVLSFPCWTKGGIAISVIWDYLVVVWGLLIFVASIIIALALSSLIRGVLSYRREILSRGYLLQN